MVLIATIAHSASAQDAYPRDVVTLITHSSPGGGSDVFLRQLARFLSPELGVDIVVENVRGGSGARAIAELVNSPADGSTFYAYTPTIIYTSLLSNPAYTFRDLEPLVNVFFDQDVIYTSAAGPFMPAWIESAVPAPKRGLISKKLGPSAVKKHWMLAGPTMGRPSTMRCAQATSVGSSNVTLRYA